MDRNKQFQNVEELGIWYDEIINIYEAAFWIHYRFLNKEIENWVDAVNDEDLMPRVIYFVNTEHMSIVLSELLLTIEVLLKAELVRYGLRKTEVTNGGHGIIGLLDRMKSADKRCLEISKMFEQYRDELAKADNGKAFVNTRYIDWEKYQLNDESAFIIKELVIILDNVYERFYGDFDIERLLYLSMDASFGGNDFSDDEIERLRRLGLWD
jgi:hypothetical protein